MREESEIREELESARETANDLEENEQHLDAIATMVVFHTLRWVVEDGEEDLNEELKQIKEE